MFNTADILKARAVLFTLELPLRSERMYFIAFKMLSKTFEVVGNHPFAAEYQKNLDQISTLQ